MTISKTDWLQASAFKDRNYFRFIGQVLFATCHVSAPYTKIYFYYYYYLDFIIEVNYIKTIRHLVIQAIFLRPIQILFFFLSKTKYYVN